MKEVFLNMKSLLAGKWAGEGFAKFQLLGVGGIIDRREFGKAFTCPLACEEAFHYEECLFHDCCFYSLTVAVLIFVPLFCKFL